MELMAAMEKQANLVHFPPDFQPIPCTPLFFDLASKHLAFPPLNDKVMKQLDKTEQKSKDDQVEQKAQGGLTGYIKGISWGIFGFGN